MIETAVFATSPVQLSVCSRQRMTQRARISQRSPAVVRVAVLGSANAMYSPE